MPVVCQIKLLALALLCIGPREAPAADVTFRNDVMAVLSKAGCNAGTCHGNANGKGGFKLSLRGQDTDLDFAALTRDQFARRVDPQQPDASLILLKATTEIAHEGGRRFAKDSPEFAILYKWIAAGTPADAPDTPKLQRLDVTPLEHIAVEPADSVQLHVEAVFSDGSRRDVTRLAVFDPANQLVKASADGLVRREKFGEGTVLVRFLGQQVPVRLAFVPARPGFAWKKPAANNYVDENIFAKLRSLRINPSELCSDEVFLRRASLDLLGVIPSAEEARSFLADKHRDRRSRLVDALLQRPEFADFWAIKWADLLRNEELTIDRKGVQDFHHWIRQSLAENKPLDQFVRELIAARGSSYSSPAANYYRANRDPVKRAEATAQVFLGTRLQCAQCHNHPFDRWTQGDYQSWTALFTRVDYRVLENIRKIGSDVHEWKGEQIVVMTREAAGKNARAAGNTEPRFLGGPNTEREGRNAQSDADYLEALAAWLTSPDNPFFARTQVNRVWFHLMGRGLVEPIDDFRATNPASHPALLDALTRDFVKHKFDLRWLVRFVMASRAYQLSSEPNDTNADDEVNFSHAAVRQLTAEQLIDSQSAATGAPLKFFGFPEGTRAAQLPRAHAEKRRDQKPSAPDVFLEVFGKPARLLTTESERCSEPTMGQAFQMISGPTINDLVARKDNRLGRLLDAGKSNRDILVELYWAALARAPKSAEFEQTLALVERAKNRRQTLEDVLWGLLNAKEFVLRQ
ncbi:MAG: DUF1549 domain-containing protein [Verrucomicrobia bacterium]|nr:DUF1549 domain-containing protein [Verrucomicrobiota bacterium]